RSQPGPDGEVRFTMLETIRAYAAERLEASPDAVEVRDRHAAHFAGMAEEADSALMGPSQAEWHRRLGTDYANLRAAMESSLGRGDLGTAARLVLSLHRYW